MTTNHLAKITIISQDTREDVEKVIFEHSDTGFQIEITPGHDSFVIASSQGLVFIRRYSDMAYEVFPERGGQVFELEKVESNDAS